MKKNLILFVFLGFLFFVFGREAEASLPPGNTSFKKGVGRAWSEDSAASLKALGASWSFSWHPDPDAFNLLSPDVQHVPMIWGRLNENLVITINRIIDSHPDSYWLIWNEPNVDDQSNILPEEAAQIYHDEILPLFAGHSGAKLIVGGVAYASLDWLQRFRDAYYSNYGRLPPRVKGWAVHFYPDQNFFDEGAWHRSLEVVRDWMNDPANGGPKELWLTEFGCITDDGLAQTVMNKITPWLEQQFWITRYAWYATHTSWPDHYYSGALLNSNGSLTTLGTKYASFGHPWPTATPTPSSTPALTPTSSPSPTPTPSLCPNGDLGNLDCDSSSLIDETDLSILLGSWSPFNLFPTPLPGQWPADLNNDNHVDSADLSILLGNWNP